MKNLHFKVRCSSLGKICAAKGFGKTGESVVIETLLNDIYDRKEEISSKYLEKGNVCEAESIEMLNNFNEISGFKIKKNEVQFENDFIKGTPDFIIPNLMVKDVKNSYSHATFPLFDTELDYLYKWQIKGYMWLLGLKKGSVDYFLNDMPENLIEKECWAKVRKLGLDEVTEELYNEVKAYYTYSHLPLHLRYKKFDVELTDADIEFMKVNCSKAIEFANTLIKNYNEFISVLK